MKFRTEIEIKPTLSLRPESKILTFGSCFADRMGSYFASLGLAAEINPYGVVYNPISIAKLLKATSSQKVIGKWEQQSDLWLNTMYHGQFNDADLAVAEERLLKVQQSTQERLQSANLLVITLGTSYAFKDVHSGEIVTNCHRLPASRFQRVLLSIDEMYTALSESLSRLIKENDNLQVVLTVSPVRHVRDSLSENSLSKSQLVCLAHRLVNDDEQFHYFPSYEIMMDDLRDYRFYDAGLVQPNDQALQYIREKFRDYSYSSNLKSYEKDALSLLKVLAHRSKNDSSENREFEEKKARKLTDFRKKYPFTHIDHS